MSTFKIKYNCNVTPKEITTLGDGSDTVTTIHSTIEKSIGSGAEISLGNAIGDYAYATGTITYGTAQDVKDLTSFSSSDVVKFLFVRVTSMTTDGEGLNISFNGGTNSIAILDTVGDFFCARVGEQQDSDTYTADQITFTAAYSGESVGIEIFVGKA